MASSRTPLPAAFSEFGYQVIDLPLVTVTASRVAGAFKTWGERSGDVRAIEESTNKNLGKETTPSMCLECGGIRQDIILGP